MTITEDCPECDGTGELAQGDACRYCGGRGKLETDIDQEAVIGDDKLDIQDADLLDGEPRSTTQPQK